MTWLEGTRAEHEELRSSIRADFAEFRAEMRGELRQEMAHFREEMVLFRQEMVGLIQASEARLTELIRKEVRRLDDRIGAVEVRIAEVKADLMKWSFMFWVGAVLAIAALAGVLR